MTGTASGRFKRESIDSTTGYSRRRYAAVAPAARGALMLLLCAESCTGFAWHPSRVPSGVRQGERVGERNKQAVASAALPRTRLLAGALKEGEDAARAASAAVAEKVKPKVVKPWLTKAQETVDYSNVEAM